MLKTFAAITHKRKNLIAVILKRDFMSQDRLGSLCLLSQDLSNYFSVNVSQSPLNAVVIVSELGVIDAEKM